MAPRACLPVALITDQPKACVVSKKVKMIRIGQASFKKWAMSGLLVYTLIIESQANHSIDICIRDIRTAIMKHTQQYSMASLGLYSPIAFPAKICAAVEQPIGSMKVRRPMLLICDCAAAYVSPRYVAMKVKISKAHQPQMPMNIEPKHTYSRGPRFVKVSLDMNDTSLYHSKSI